MLWVQWTPGRLYSSHLTPFPLSQWPITWQKQNHRYPSKPNFVVVSLLFTILVMPLTWLFFQHFNREKRSSLPQFCNWRTSFCDCLSNDCSGSQLCKLLGHAKRYFCLWHARLALFRLVVECTDLIFGCLKKICEIITGCRLSYGVGTRGLTGRMERIFGEVPPLWTPYWIFERPGCAAFYIVSFPCLILNTSFQPERSQLQGRYWVDRLVQAGPCAGL